MSLYQQETNTAGHGMGSHQEANFRYWGVDPELLCDPFDTVVMPKTQPPKSSIHTQEPSRPLSADVARNACETSGPAHHAATLAVHLSFEVR